MDLRRDAEGWKNNKNNYFKAKNIAAAETALAEHSKCWKTCLRKLWDSKTWLPPKNPASMAPANPDKDIFKQRLKTKINRRSWTRKRSHVIPEQMDCKSLKQKVSPTKVPTHPWSTTDNRSGVCRSGCARVCSPLWDRAVSMHKCGGLTLLGLSAARLTDLCLWYFRSQKPDCSQIEGVL